MNGLSIAPTLAVVAVLLFFPSTLAVGQVAPRSCGGLAGDSRWVGESYRDTQVYGLSDPEEWIGSYGGLVTAGDSLFLYDQGRARIVHLSGNLEERHVFGRQGEGPGEFNALPLPWLDDASEGHVAFDGRQLVVYDRNDLTSFDAEGEYRWSALLGDFGFNLGRKGVVFVSPVDEEEVIYGVDALGAGPRRLQLWRMRRPDRNRGELLWEQTVPTRSRDDRENGRASIHRRQARSYWARHQDCVVVSDGGGPFLWVVDLATLQADSVALPQWNVPEFGELRSDRSVLNIGGRVVQTRPQAPALLWRWRGLIVDPDGHAWVRAWTQSREEFQVFVVSLASGESRHLNPPGFPTAFGPPGVFYTVRQASETDEQYLVRFQGRP